MKCLIMGEYFILDDVIKYSQNVNILIIEFHETDSKKERTTMPVIQISNASICDSFKASNKNQEQDKIMPNARHHSQVIEG